MCLHFPRLISPLFCLYRAFDCFVTAATPVSVSPRVAQRTNDHIPSPVLTGVWLRTRTLSITEHPPPCVHRGAATVTYVLLYVLLRPFGVSPASHLVGQGSPPSPLFYGRYTSAPYETHCTHVGPRVTCTYIFGFTSHLFHMHTCAHVCTVYVRTHMYASCRQMAHVHSCTPSSLVLLSQVSCPPRS